MTQRSIEIVLWGVKYPIQLRTLTKITAYKVNYGLKTWLLKDGSKYECFKVTGVFSRFIGAFGIQWSTLQEAFVFEGRPNCT